MDQMTDARTAYSRLNPDSPWRWVPYPTLALAAGTLCVSPMSVRFSPFVIALLGVVTTVCWWSFRKMGSPRAVLIAREWEAESGGVRANTLPGLAIAMRVLGPIFAFVLAARIFQLVLAMLALTDGSPDNYDLFPRYIDTPLLLFAGALCTLWGWTRPWDLKVVERESVAG